MRIAIVSDIHGNLTALDAVIADLRETAPDLVLHGGDLADSGSAPAEVVDRIRGLGWEGVAGNTDEMLFRPDSLAEFARDSPQVQPLLPLLEAMARAARETLGENRLAWLQSLPDALTRGPVALVHAGPNDAWRAPSPEAAASELKATYSPLDQPVVVYGHIHRPFVRRLDQLVVVNPGSVSLSYDGDPRASYALIDGQSASIRRIGYDTDREIQRLHQSGLPYADWIARMLASGRYESPRLPIAQETPES